MSAVKPLCFVHGTLVLPGSSVPDGVLVCEDGRIAALGRAAEIRIPNNSVVIDAHSGLIAPGFVDIHVHGGDGADFMDGTEAAARTVCRAHARHGTTSIFPTTTTGSPAQIRAMLDACRAVRDAGGIDSGARVAGIHFYGPYFAATKVGCHRPEDRRDPDPEEYRAAFASGLVRIATCAAELPGAEDFYRAAAAAGCLATCGHSNANWSEMARAYAAGMRHVDHFWCAMSSVPAIRERCGYPMQGSMEQFVIFHSEMSTEVIADGCHLAPELLEYAYRMKGAARLCLCTDANRALGLPPGEYAFGPEESGSTFVSDGKVASQPGRGLASAIVGMDTMVRTMARATSAPLHDVIRMASLTPAERAGIAEETGSLAVGKRADVLVLDATLAPRRVFIGGEEFA
jgi:N-acetylglucosamine-6-phosphate deacetylase